jgi:hypothetical protein
VLDKSIIQKQNMGAQVKREISIMKLVRHSYVVQLKEVSPPVLPACTMHILYAHHQSNSMCTWFSKGESRIKGRSWALQQLAHELTAQRSARLQHSSSNQQ